MGRHWERAAVDRIFALLIAGQRPARQMMTETAVSVVDDKADVRKSLPVGSDMPSATFCVYRGVAFDHGGEVCATDIVVIWSSMGSRSRMNVQREVYLGFVTDPGLVLRAVVDSQHDHRAELVEYTLSGNETSRPLAGETTLRTAIPGSSGMVDMLSIKVRESPEFRCSSGFVGCELFLTHQSPGAARRSPRDRRENHASQRRMPRAALDADSGRSRRTAGEPRPPQKLRTPWHARSG